jgi:hypothetical protein
MSGRQKIPPFCTIRIAAALKSQNLKACMPLLFLIYFFFKALLHVIFFKSLTAMSSQMDAGWTLDGRLELLNKRVTSVGS